MKKYKRLFIVLLTIFVVTIFIAAINYNKTKQIDLGSMLKFHIRYINADFEPDLDADINHLGINLDDSKFYNYLLNDMGKEINTENYHELKDMNREGLYSINFSLPNKMILHKTTETLGELYNLDEIEKANGLIPLKVEYNEEAYENFGYSLPKKINIKLNVDKLKELRAKDEEYLSNYEKNVIDFEYHY